MKTAISRHLENKNAFIRENPERIGNEISDKQFFGIDSILEGVLKRM